MNYLKRVVGGIFFLLAATGLYAQSPHGKELTISCDACHTADSWQVAKDSISFDHDTTHFALDGQHEVIDCKQCHTTLSFQKRNPIAHPVTLIFIRNL